MIDWSLQLSLPGGDEAILELERLWVDSLRAAARGEPLVRATSMIHSTRARTKLSLANVSLCSFYNHIINKVDDLEKCICTKKYIYICQTSSRVSWVSSGATKTIGPSIWLGDVPKASAPNWFSKLDLRCRLQLLPLLFCKAPYPWIGLRLPQGEPAISTSVWLRWNPPELGFALHIVTVGEATKKIIQDRTSAGRNNNSTSGKFFNAKAMREKEKKRLKKKKSCRTTTTYSQIQAESWHAALGDSSQQQLHHRQRFSTEPYLRPRVWRPSQTHWLEHWLT